MQIFLLIQQTVVAFAVNDITNLVVFLILKLSTHTDRDRKKGREKSYLSENSQGTSFLISIKEKLRPIKINTNVK